MADNYRMERIERLFRELQHEIERGLVEAEIDEHITYQFVFPRSRKIPGGVIAFVARLEPTLYHGAVGNNNGLRIVKT